jgi:hypothetical protein
MLRATSAILCTRLRGSPVISPAGLAAGDGWGETSCNVTMLVAFSTNDYVKLTHCIVPCLHQTYIWLITRIACILVLYPRNLAFSVQKN